jgi:DNA-binding beta-propeller fold protein YncE
MSRIYVFGLEDSGIEELLTTINIGRGKVSGMAINPNTSILYLANTLNGTVSVVNASSLHSKSEFIIIPGSPDAISVNPKTNMIYASDRFSGKVHVIDGRSHFIRPIQISMPSPMVHVVPMSVIPTSMDFPQAAICYIQQTNCLIGS